MKTDAVGFFSAIRCLIFTIQNYRLFAFNFDDGIMDLVVQFAVLFAGLVKVGRLVQFGLPGIGILADAVFGYHALDSSRNFHVGPLMVVVVADLFGLDIPDMIMQVFNDLFKGYLSLVAAHALG